MLFSRRARGLFCGSVAAITYGMNPLFAKPLYAVGMTPDAVLFWRYASASVILALIMLAQKISFAMTGKQLITSFLLGTTMALSSLTLYLSYCYMDSGAASTILFVYPVMVAAIMAGCFHEKLSLVTVGSILVSVAGVAVLSMKGEGVEANDLFLGVLNSVLSGCMYDEFQREVYEDPDMTLEEINDLAEVLAYEYGLDGTGCEAFDWVDVSHTFDMPCYYISYATSALSALDIWRQSLEDWDGAVDRYMQVTAVDSSMGYLETVKQCGLMDFTDQRAVRQLAKDLGEWFAEQYPEYADGGSGSSGDVFPEIENMHGLSDKIDKAAGNAKAVLSNVLKALLIVAVLATLIVIAIIALLWKRHKGEEITNQTPPNPGYTEDPTGISSYYQEVKPNTQSVPPEDGGDPADEIVDEP